MIYRTRRWLSCRFPGPSCPEAIDVLANQKNVKAFIVVSAGFGEETHEGALLEDQMLATVNEAGASMIGPNCIGLMEYEISRRIYATYTRISSGWSGFYFQLRRYGTFHYRVCIDKRVAFLICLVGR